MSAWDIINSGVDEMNVAPIEKPKPVTKMVMSDDWPEIMAGAGHVLRIQAALQQQAQAGLAQLAQGNFAAQQGQGFGCQAANAEHCPADCPCRRWR